MDKPEGISKAFPINDIFPMNFYSISEDNERITAQQSLDRVEPILKKPVSFKNFKRCSFIYQARS